ncbi:MAG: type VI secretion system tip protein TssI/VgrG [Polyangiaceae bacterium]
MAPPMHHVVFSTDGVDPETVIVRRLGAFEGMSRPHSVSVELEVRPSLPRPGAWVGQKGTVAVIGSEGAIVRTFAGVITRVAEVARVVEPQALRVVIEPPLAMLRFTEDSRIFQEQTTKDIVSTLLGEHNVTDFEFRLVGDYPTREVCTQYQEDVLSFISRLLEEDGIFYFHEHGEDGAKLVFGDDSSAYATTNPDSLRFREESGLSSEPAFTELSLFEAVRPAKVTLRDHLFKNPALDLEAEAESDAVLGREHYDFPGRYVEPNEGKRRAQVRLDALTAAAVGARGASTAFALTPGHAFHLDDAPDPELEGDWVVRDIEHLFEARGAESSYSNQVALLKKDTVFRPPTTVAEVDMPGPQLAIVTGPAGEEIHTDEFGRIKVRFPWDRRATGDDKSSCWVRVSQLHSSGSVAIPRVGWEMLVDFEGGDPDRPIALGRLYNAQYTPPNKLPDNKTQSALQSMSTPGGGGHNEIRAEDSGGGEHVHVHAQKDMNVVIANNKTEKVTTSAALGVGSNHSRTVGANSTLDVGANEQLQVGGSQTVSIGASRTQTVSGDEKIDVQGDRSLTIGGSHTTMTPMTVSASTPASYSETVGGSVIEATALGCGTTVAGACSITVGGVHLAACATGASTFTLGAQATTVGGAFVSASGKDVAVNVGGAKATTVGGAWAANAGGDVAISSDASIRITVGAALAFNGASAVVMKVGGSNVTVSSGGVVIKSSTIKLTATGPQPELAPLVEDK